MSRQGSLFLATLVPTAAAVAALVLFDQTLIAVLAGVAGIMVHWWLTRSADHDGELADSSYFFGFLLTLVFLVVGLYDLSAASAATDVPADATARRVGGFALLRFLEELAAGLMLTVVGLAVRQVRTLSNVRDAAAAAPAQENLTRALEELIQTLRMRPEAQVAHELDEARSRARESVDRFDQSVSAAARRMAGSIESLEAAVTDATNAMQRAGAHLGDSLSEAMQRVEAELNHALAAIQRQREDAENALSGAQSAAAAMRIRADEQLRAHTELWQGSLDQARAAIEQTHSTLDEHYRRGIAAFAETGTAFRELSEQTLARVQAMPDPAERLAGLWDGVRDLEAKLTQSLTAATGQLHSLREHADQLGAGFTRLASTANDTAAAVTAGGNRMGDALLREIQQMNRIIEEYTTLLEKTSRALASRR